MLKENVKSVLTNAFPLYYNKANREPMNKSSNLYDVFPESPGLVEPEQ